MHYMYLHLTCAVRARTSFGPKDQRILGAEREGNGENDQKHDYGEQFLVDFWAKSTFVDCSCRKSWLIFAENQPDFRVISAIFRQRRKMVENLATANSHFKIFSQK